MHRSRALLSVLVLILFGSLIASAQCTPATNPGAKICSPVNGGTYTSPVSLIVGTADTHPISAIYTYVDNVVVNKTYASSVNTTISIAAGAHNVRVQVWDSTGAILRDSVNITVSGTPPAVSISLSPSNITLLVNTTQQFTAKVSNSSNTGVNFAVDGVVGGNGTTGIISDSGLYTAPAAAGSHIIRATSVADTTKYSEASVSVVTQMPCAPTTDPGAKICAPTNGSAVVSPFNVQVVTRDTAHRISAIYTYVDNVVVNKTFATTANFSATATSGAHNLRVQVWDTSGAIYRDSVSITVSSGPPQTTVTVTPSSANVATGGTQQFTATVANNSNTAVNWAVDGYTGGSAALGTISASGLYTAPSTAGTHTIAATSVADNTRSGFASITVAAPPSGVTISPRQAVITPEQTKQFTANTTVNWSVDGIVGGNSTVGTISSSGLYTPPSTAGEHQITATMASDATKSASVPVFVSTYAGTFTYHYDNARTGQQTNEIALSPANVNHNQFGKLFSRSVDGFVFAQPLYMRCVTIGSAKHNVVFVATEHASVYAFDADGNNSTPLWHRTFINPTAGINVVTGAEVNNYDLGPEVSITSTPVIDPAAGTMYVLVRTNENGTYFQRLHAISLSTGADTMTAATISATVNGSGVGGDGAGHISFNNLVQNQRPSLLLANGNVYIGWASHGDNGAYHGWLLAYSASTMQRVGVFNTTPNGKDGGIWMGGAGPAADANGNIYVATGNGTNDVTGSALDFGDSYMKFSSTLAPLDYFTPFDQSTLNSGDLDLGSSGLVLVPDQAGSFPHVLVGSGKRGDLYVINRDAMGGFRSGSNTNALQYISRAVGVNSVPDQFFGIGSYWNGNMYFAGSFDHLKQFTMANGLLSSTPVHTSVEALSSDRSAEPIISSNGNSNGIVWVIATDTYQSNTSALVLHAYDANNVGTELYNNTQAGTRDLGGKVVKFTAPTVANGRVYVGTRNSLDVYGLLP